METKKSENPKNPQLAQRTIRVFVSSTFLDREDERKLLGNMVFPALREFTKNGCYIDFEIQFSVKI
ncbi:MAG: DUF4062 domain-containing protein [bacterium]|nr:DUF4062 domain-containing protein [bacterium]